MRGRVARSAVALGSAGLVVLSMAACQQSKPEEETSQTDLKIVEQVQIDDKGGEVKAAEGAAAADPGSQTKLRFITLVTTSQAAIEPAATPKTAVASPSTRYSSA